MLENQILLSLADEERAGILRNATRVPLVRNSILHGPKRPIEYVYFLESGLASLFTTGPDNRAIETGVIGREGLVGSQVILESPMTNGHAMVRLSGEALQIPVAPFLQCYASLPGLRKLVNGVVSLLLVQAEQNALCHALHSVEARFCRWVLQASDHVGADMLELKQEACSFVLGVQRTSVSTVAHALQVAGIIRTRRGKIQIQDRIGLERMACDCYQQLKQRTDALYSMAAFNLQGTAVLPAGRERRPAENEATYLAALPLATKNPVLSGTEIKILLSSCATACDQEPCPLWNRNQNSPRR
jgi:CRP-like cAMP-binding protein